MSISGKYDSDGCFVETTLSGIVTPAELSEEIEIATALTEENGCSLILSDYSQADIRFSVTDIYDLPELQTDKGLEQAARIALLAPPSTLGRQLAQFYETVSVNRGWVARAFEERDEALDWLLIGSIADDDSLP